MTAPAGLVAIKSAYEQKHNGNGNQPSGSLPGAVRWEKKLSSLLVRDFLNVVFPPVRERVAGFIPIEGYGVISGAAKAGKSAIARELSVCVAAGLAWMGGSAEQCPVILIEEEGAKVGFQDKLRRTLKKYNLVGKDLPLHVLHRTMLSLQDAAWLQELEDLIVATGARLVVMSSMAQVGGIKEENDQREHNEIHNALRGIIDRHGVVFVIAVHTGKASVRTPPRDVDTFFNGVRANSALMGAVDFGIGILRRTEDVEGTMFYMGRDFPSRKWAVVFDVTTLTFESDASRALAPRDKTEQQILEMFELPTHSGAKMKVSEVCKWVAQPRSTVQRHLDKLVSEGVIKAERAGLHQTAAWVYSHDASAIALAAFP